MQQKLTNAEFAAFVKATGYVTVAEQKPQRKNFRCAEENLVAGFCCIYALRHNRFEQSFINGGIMCVARIGNILSAGK
jgi:formylglycine-generating enzyme required for sulfatase activity